MNNINFKDRSSWNIYILVLFPQSRNIKVKDNWKMMFFPNIIWSRVSHCCLSKSLLKRGRSNSSRNIAVPFTSFCKHSLVTDSSLNNYLFRSSVYNSNNSKLLTLKMCNPKIRCVLRATMLKSLIWNEWKLVCEEC